MVEKEATEKQMKPKKRRNKLAPLIKQSCKRLEREEEEYDRQTEEKIFKKLKKMSDILQVPVGKKKVTVPNKLEKSDEMKSRKRKRPSGNDSWTVTAVTESIDDAGSQTSNARKDWTVMETDDQDSVESMEGVEVTKSLSPITEDKSVVCTKRPRLRSLSKESTNSSISDFSIQSITEELVEIGNRASVDKSPSVEMRTINELPRKVSDVGDGTSSVNLSPPKRPANDEEDVFVTETSAAKTKELSGKRGRSRRASVLEDVPESSVLSETEIKKPKRRRTEADTLLDSTRDTTPPPSSTVTTSPQTPSMRTRSRMRSRAEASMERTIVNEQTANERNSIAAVRDKVERKSKRRVSFDENPSTVTYPAEKEDSNDEPREVLVPLSLVKDRPRLLKKDTTYKIIDMKVVRERVRSRQPSHSSTSEDCCQVMW